MESHLVIDTPRGVVFEGPKGKAELKWKADFKPKWWIRYSRAQKFVDSEILRRSEPYIPLRTGMLIKSGILGTEVGSGAIHWIAIYSRWQYYHTRAPGSETGPLRGPYWFERMKTVHGKNIVAGGRKIAGGKA
jgi:hypothetical protein